MRLLPFLAIEGELRLPAMGPKLIADCYLLLVDYFFTTSHLFSWREC